MTASDQQGELNRLEAEYQSLLNIAADIGVITGEVAASGRVRQTPPSWYRADIRYAKDAAKGKLLLAGSMLDAARVAIEKRVNANLILPQVRRDLARLHGYLECLVVFGRQKSAIANKAKKATTHKWQEEAAALYRSRNLHRKTHTQAAALISGVVHINPKTVATFLSKEFPKRKREAAE